MLFSVTDYQLVKTQPNLSLELLPFSSSSGSSSSSSIPALASSALSSSSREIAGISPKQLENFIKSSELFEHVRDKQGAVDRLEAVASKKATPKKLLRLSDLGQDADIDDLTVLAHLSGKISADQLATMFYWRSAYKLYSDKNVVQEIPLFLKDGRINPFARTIIAKTVAPVGKGKIPILTNQEIEKWFYLMKRQPASEQRLLLGPQLKIFTVMDAIFRADANLFNRIKHKGKNYRLFPTMGMVKTLFAMHKDAQDIRLVYRFGASHSVRNNGLRGERDITLRNPYQLTPKKADYFPAPWADYTSHDLLFHAYIANFVPLEHQRLFVELGDMFAKEANHYLADRFYDMECDSYRPEFQFVEEYSLTIAFAFTCFTYFAQAIDRQQKEAEVQKKPLLEQNADENHKLRTAARAKIVHYLTSKETPSDLEQQVAVILASEKLDEHENYRYQQEKAKFAALNI